MATSLRAPLPDILPGAMPQLAKMELELAQLEAALPASWGAASDTLPALQYLHVCLRHSAHGRLPPEWARGFPRLGELHLTDSSSVCCCRAELHPAATPPVLLPPEWASPGASPSPPLTEDALGEPCQQASMPCQPCFCNALPSAEGQVMLRAFTTLPGCIPCALPYALLQLEGNEYTGGLPDEWAASSVSIYWQAGQQAVCWPIDRSARGSQASIAAGLMLQLQSRHGPSPTPSAALPMPTVWLIDSHHALAGVSPMFVILCCSYRAWGCVATSCQAPPSPPSGCAQAR